MRGILTEKIQECARRHFGRDITTAELRLMPYIISCLMDGIRLNWQKMSTEELSAITAWENEAYIQTDGKVKVTQNFYLAITELVWLGYINLEQ